jgi:16S rRNA (adenine1518-N6/adenine1519-N6)-dimethyltransferase
MAKSDQYILIDDLVLHRIIAYAGLRKSDVVLEIGAGTGVLTEKLAERAERVIAIESDPSFARLLDQRFKNPNNTNNTNVEIVHGDALKIEFPRFNKIVSNLPYSISSQITFKLLEYPFETAILMYQYEFAKRMAASHGSKDYGRLSISVQYKTNVELLEIVPATAFSPEPSVQSAIVRLTMRAPEYDVLNYDFFSKFLNAVFSQRRKKLRNSIKSFANIRGLDIPESLLNMRPEELPAYRLAEISDGIYSRLSGE